MSSEDVDSLTLADLEIDSVECAQLPRDFFPECWKDNVRMDVLFAPFRPRDINPLNYDNKMKFWKQMIQKYCDQKGSAAVSLAELRTAFKRADKRPHALEAVLDDMQSNRELQSIQTFLEPPQHTWRDWAKRHVSHVINWPMLVVMAAWQKSQLEKQTQCVILDAVSVRNHFFFYLYTK